MIFLRDEHHALWLSQTTDAGGALLVENIDDLNGVVAESGDEKPLSFGINGEVIEVAGDTWQRDSSDEFQRVVSVRAKERPESQRGGGERSFIDSHSTFLFAHTEPDGVKGGKEGQR